VTAIGHLILTLELLVESCKLETDGALRWKVEDHQLRRVGSVMCRVDTSKVVAPSVSVKDRCVGPREHVLNVLITCW
jgi:hypothetical protein